MGISPWPGGEWEKASIRSFVGGELNWAQF